MIYSLVPKPCQRLERVLEEIGHLSPLKTPLADKAFLRHAKDACSSLQQQTSETWWTQGTHSNFHTEITSSSNETTKLEATLPNPSILRQETRPAIKMYPDDQLPRAKGSLPASCWMAQNGTQLRLWEAILISDPYDFNTVASSWHKVLQKDVLRCLVYFLLGGRDL